MEDDFADLGGDPADDLDLDLDPGDGGSDPNGGGDPAGGGDGAIDLDAIAAEAEAKAAAELGVQPPARKGEGSGDGAGGSADLSHPHLKAFIEKNYGGDPDKLIEGFYASRAEATRLAEENRQLKAGRKPGDPGSSSTPQVPSLTPEQRDAAIKTAKDRSSEFQTFNQEITHIDATITAREQELVRLANEAQGLSTEIAGLETKRDNTEDASERARLNAEILLKRSRIDNLDTKWTTTSSLIESDKRMRRGAEYNLKRVERDIAAEVDGRVKAQQRDFEVATNTRRNFDSAFLDIAKEYNLDMKTDEGKYRYNQIRSRMSDYMDQRAAERKPGLDANGIYEATRRLFAQAEKYDGLKRRTAPPPPPNSRPKVQPSRPLSQRGVPAAAASATARAGAEVARTGGNGNGGAQPVTEEDLYNNPDFWRKRSAEISRQQRQLAAAAGRGGPR
jgi:hypothetical protein